MCCMHDTEHKTILIKNYVCLFVCLYINASLKNYLTDLNETFCDMLGVS